MIRNLAGQTQGAQVLNASTGAPFVGTVLCYVTIDDGTQALGTTNSGVCTAKGNGEFDYTPSASETDGRNVKLTWTGTGAINVTINFPTVTASAQSAVQSATGVGSCTVEELLEDAFAELGVYAPGEAIASEDLRFALGKLNRLLDNLNAERSGVYADEFTEFTIVASTNPHSIGPNSANWTATQRPVSIEGANLIISGIRYPIDLHDAAWWRSIAESTFTSTYATDAYYNPTWPNGSFYLWPVPSSAYIVELQNRIVLTQLTISSTFWMPPGYRDMVTLTLAEELQPAFPDRQLHPQTKESARAGRARTAANNIVIPSLRTADDGMPSGRRGSFDWRTRTVR